MITKMKEVGSVVRPLELIGLSTDTKPTGYFEGYPVINGSSFLEMDTGILYWYDEASEDWIR